MSVGDIYYEERMDIDRVIKDGVNKIYAALRERGERNPETGLLRHPIEEWFRMVIISDDIAPRNAIYFIADGSLESRNTGIKIGKTSDIEGRLTSLQVGNKSKLKLLAIIPQCSDYEVGEKYLHGVFKKDRMRGEWFRNSTSLSGFINVVTSVYKNISTYRDIHIKEM